MKVLILGGNGYIGSRFANYLRQQGIYVMTNDIGWHPFVTKINYKGDYNEITPGYLEIFSHIILLAGHSSVASTGDRLIYSFDNNVRNFVHLIDKMNEDQVLLYASTAANYGNNDRLVTEDEPIPDPIKYYDYTKIAIEKISNLYPDRKLIGLRFGTVGGWSMNFRYENLLNSVSYNAIQNNKVTISNGDNWRAVLGMNDLCRAVEVMLHQQPKERFYNLVSFNGKILEIGKTVAELSGAELIENDSMSTGYSFNCSNERFCQEYSFEFKDTISSIFYEIQENLKGIELISKRDEQRYP